MNLLVTRTVCNTKPVTVEYSATPYSRSLTARPSADGTRVYLNAYPEIDLVLNRIENAGGKIIVPKTQIKAGFIAVITDTEGNSVGLHAEK